MKTMRIDAAGAAFIKKEEGLRLKAYRCKGGVWTVGYGHTGDVRPGEQITLERAEELFERDVRLVETCICTAVGPDITRNMFNALCSFVFNVGRGAFLRSRLLKKINANPLDATITDEFKMWSYAGGRFADALFRRRCREAGLYHKKDMAEDE